MPAGRPDKFKEEYIELAKETIGRQGKSIVQFARDIEVDRRTVYRWAEKNEEFRHALSRAKDWSLAFWQDKLQTCVEDRNSNPHMMKLVLWTQFGISENKKQDEDLNQKPPSVQVNIVCDNGQSK